MKIKLIVAGLVGMVLGILGSRYLLVGSWLTLIPWGIVGLLIGAWCAGYRAAILVGSVYGFLMAFTFMLTGYEGSAPILSRLPFFVALGLVGAVCGTGLGVAGSFVRARIKK